MERSHEWLQAALGRGLPVYGVSLGVGDLHQAPVAPEDHEQFQYNTVRSHCCAVGPALDRLVVRGAMASRAAVLARGYSAVRPQVVEGLVALLDADVVPVVPSRGSVGASGDTALLAHVAAVLIGEGSASTGAGIISGREALESADIVPLRLAPRDGLGLINGLDFSVASLALVLERFERLTDWALAIAGLTIDLLGASSDPFELAQRQEYAPAYQRGVAARIASSTRREGRSRRAGSQQDPYSIRCVPQICGSSISALQHVCRVVDDQLTAVVDNPLIDAERNRLLHGGMFHGQRLALAADYAATAISTVANSSHERIRLLLSGRGLPAKQAASPGLANGLMMIETTTASLVAAIRAQATPLSVQNVSASTAQEDHVSMAWEAVRRLHAMAQDVQWVVAAEALAASNGARISGLDTLAPGTGEVASRLLRHARLGDGDQELTTAIEALAELIAAEPAP